MQQNRIKELLDLAWQAAKKAYAPYSNFPVGCVVLLKSGERFIGVNIENASYPVGICAERSAMARVVTEGRHHEIEAVAVVTAADLPGTPCGMCRQFLSEFLSPETPIYYGSPQGDFEITTMEKLLPHAFSKSALTPVLNNHVHR